MRRGEELTSLSPLLTSLMMIVTSSFTVVQGKLRQKITQTFTIQVIDKNADKSVYYFIYENDETCNTTKILSKFPDTS